MTVSELPTQEDVRCVVPHCKVCLCHVCVACRRARWRVVVFLELCSAYKVSSQEKPSRLPALISQTTAAVLVLGVNQRRVLSGVLPFSAVTAECARAGRPPHTVSCGLWQSYWSCDLAAEKEDTSTACSPVPPLWEIT